MKAPLAVVLLVVVAVLSPGCYAVHEVSTRSQLEDAAPAATLRVLSVDGSVIELTTYTWTDSTLEGSGTRIRPTPRSPFSGRLFFRDLVYIQAREGGFWRTGAMALDVITVAGWFSSASHEHGLSIYPTGGGSCPYIYVRGAAGYVLEGEAFGTSFGRALEATTTGLLPDAAVRDGAIHVRLANERPETHYVNQASLVAFAVPRNAAVRLDDANRAWPVVDPRPPTAGDVRWRPAPEGRCAEAGPDRIQLVFGRPEAAASGSIVVDAINTDLAYAAFRLVFGYLDEESLPFLERLENDFGLVDALKDWIEACSLIVEVQDGERWEPAGRIAPEAATVPFSRLVRIPALRASGDSLRVRLTGIGELWKIAAVTVDWTRAEPIPGRPAALREASFDGRADAPRALLAMDDRRVVLFPGDRIDLAFDAVPEAAGNRIVYALVAGGFLHEWPPTAEPDARFSRACSRLGPDRVAAVEYLVRRREVLLPLVVEFLRPPPFRGEIW